MTLWLPAILVALLAAFCLGMLAGHRKTFPFGVLVRLRARLRASGRRSAAVDGNAAEFVVTIGSPPELEARRQALAGFVWDAGGLPLDRYPDRIERDCADDVASRFEGLATSAWWRFAMPHGIDSNALLLTPRAATRPTTIVYQHGHDGGFVVAHRVIAGLLRDGFPVVALDMPLIGVNPRPTVELRRHGRVRLHDHDYFTLLDHEFGGNSLRHFVEPVIGSINQLVREGHGRIAMLGYSGGGWATTLCAALDTRISLSVAVAGSLPFSLRERGELADYENHLPALYEIANYPELYVMSAHGKGRMALQVVNEFDTVAWAGRRGLLYQETVNRSLQRLGSGRFDVVLDSSWAGHGISAEALNLVRRSLI